MLANQAQKSASQENLTSSVKLSLATGQLKNVGAKEAMLNWAQRTITQYDIYNAVKFQIHFSSLQTI